MIKLISDDVHWTIGFVNSLCYYPIIHTPSLHLALVDARVEEVVLQPVAGPPRARHPGGPGGGD